MSTGASRTTLAALVGWLLMTGVAAAQQPLAVVNTPDDGARAKATANDSYLLGPADVVSVAVLERPDFTTQGRIESDGSIQLPFLGRVAAGGKTAAQLSEEVARALEKGGFFAHPIVTVNIVSYASRYVTVLGDVTNPGLVSIDRSYRVSEILARVGGTKDGAADYVIFKPGDGPERRIAIDALATGAADTDPYVSPGDKIYSPVADQFFISGEVKTPGSYPVLQDMTLRMALSKGGGLTDLGSDRHIKITRAGQALSKVDLDSKIHAGDVIVVGERLF